MSFQSEENDYLIFPQNSKTQSRLDSKLIESSTQEIEKINEIRKLIREQSNLTNRKCIKNVKSSNSDSSDDDYIEIPVRRFTPLPDIPRSDDVYFRTESKLIKDKEELNDINNDFIIENNYFGLNNVNDRFSSFNFTKKETRYHFGLSNPNRVNFNQRLPALDKQLNYSLQNAMDLDEDLPITNESNQQNQRMVYTSPGDRLISPIKRPQAPSPAASAYRRKSNKNSDSDTDNDLIIS